MEGKKDKDENKKDLNELNPKYKTKLKDFIDKILESVKDGEDAHY